MDVQQQIHPLRKARQGRGWRLRDLSDRAGVTTSAISKIETGKAIGRFDTLKRLAEALGVKWTDLVEE